MTESSTPKDFEEAFLETVSELSFLSKKSLQYSIRIGHTKIYSRLFKIIDINLSMSMAVKQNIILYELTQQLHDQFGITTFIDNLWYNLRLGKKIVKDIEYIKGQITNFANN